MEIERFDEYLLLAKLGEGGMAQVFLAVSQGPRRQRIEAGGSAGERYVEAGASACGQYKIQVVKRLHAHLATDPRHFELFSQEANVACMLEHPQIVRTVKAGIHRGQPFLAMEHLEGQTLGRVVARLREQNRRMAPTLATQIISLALAGLHHAHEARDYAGNPLGLVHCDVSPQNLFLTHEGEVKLLDFGIARLRSQPQTHDSVVCGTRAYIAPEQALNEEVDPRADVWSMAVTFWECLVGRPLFHGDSDDDVLRAALFDEIQPANEVAHGVPDALSRILEHALSRNRERRFDSALEFKRALDAWLATQACDEPQVAVARVLASLFGRESEERRELIRQSLARVDELVPALRQRGRRTSVPSPALASTRPPPLPFKRPSTPSGEGFHFSPAPAVLAPASGRLGRTRWGGAAVGAAAVFALAVWHTGRDNAEPRIALREPAHVAAPAAMLAEPKCGAVTVNDPGRCSPTEALAQSESATLSFASPVAPAPKNTPPVAEAGVAVGQPKLEIRERAPTTVNRAQVDVTETSGTSHTTAAVVTTTIDASRAAHEQTNGEDAAVATGRLKLDSTPPAEVFLGGKLLGRTPIDVGLPATAHTLVLKNAEQALETRYRVTLQAGETLERRVALE